MQKLYCYVDESGHHNPEEHFTVGIVIADDGRDELAEVLELIERATGKGIRKWSEASPAQRSEYVRAFCKLRMFRRKLYFAEYERLDAPVIEMAARALVDAWRAYGTGEAIGMAYFDGLPDAKVRDVTKILRDSNVPTDKVRTVRKDETDALIRLADAVCGLVRSARAKRRDMRELRDMAIKAGVLTDARQ
jgi:hypothetical protein